MGALGIMALIVLIIIVLCVVGVWVALAIMPGRIARQRGHPQADAINVCGWFGALTMGVFAPIAFIWAYSKPVMRPIELEPLAEPEIPAAGADQEVES